MKYNDILRKLYFHDGKPPPVKLGLENIKNLDKVLGYPSKSGYSIIHVAGTNGKGSVTWKAERGLVSKVIYIYIYIFVKKTKKHKN
ncbi:hypothetical protein [Aestuariivirga sp.]|uniref:hypothetical protein n=1 Tax=Aestuariivirga sp. TaxID=2650926 RepID=UPI0039E22040